MRIQLEYLFPVNQSYYTKTITPEHLIDIYKKMEKDLQGKISFRRRWKPKVPCPEFMKNIVDYLNFYFFNFDKSKI